MEGTTATTANTFLKIEGERECYCKVIVKPYVVATKARLNKITDEKDKKELEEQYNAMLKLYARTLSTTPERLERAIFGAGN